MHVRMKKFGGVALALGISMTLMSGCATDAVKSTKSADGPGTLVEVKPFADIDQSVKDLGAEALHVLYRSTSSDGRHTVVWQDRGGKWLIIHEHVSKPL